VIIDTMFIRIGTGRIRYVVDRNKFSSPDGLDDLRCSWYFSKLVLL